ncbi:MAG: 3-dehydroquinate synthase, partial [Gemmatimonadales bacterium]
PLTLVSLPEREYRCGLVEAVKHALIADAEYFSWIEENVRPLKQRQPAVLESLIRRSVEIKAEIVGADETEQGRRAILNAGHTAGHALEHESGYTMPHGEAVAVGLLIECAIAEERGIAEPGMRERMGTLLRRLGAPVQPPSVDGAGLIRRMRGDKKNRRGEIRCALPAAIGRMHRDGTQWTTAVSGEDFERVLGAR